MKLQNKAEPNSENRFDHEHPDRTTRSCQEIVQQVNAHLAEVSDDKVNSMVPCGEDTHTACNCHGEPGTEPTSILTDLIILIDTSEDMVPFAINLSGFIQKALVQAEDKCEKKVRPIFLGVDGTIPGTVFNQSHRNYIYGLHGNSVPLAADSGAVNSLSEQGSNAIEDLSQYADWRKGACRAIFYISNEELDGNPQGDYPNETASTNSAIASANSQSVTVFAHHITQQNLPTQIIQNYNALCNQTGGQAFFSNSFSQAHYFEYLINIICNSCGDSPCRELELPEIKPCIEVKWGDSNCDGIESSDHEVLTITVCNCYSNIAFSNYTIGAIHVTDAAGNPVAVLPNGRPSVQVHPLGVYCFGRIEPCSCVTREFVMITEGAPEGGYQLHLEGVCFSVDLLNQDNSACFHFDICKD